MKKSKNKTPKERIVNYSLIGISLALIGLTFTRAGVFTGNAISNLENSTIDIAVLVCVVGLIAGMIWKFKLKK